ncbi:hypothetical protein [Hymenobacter glacialis]|uniref:Uncharacterized protein n=1 Tax=Hymenobacter glacialis TaxID=1908236 RepID=A0A1G1SZ43_9BACT|nr:hypothetical protein [Hymenobacter glacialis]OGX83887.1 hypothetical protein BEN48_03770 [Hymenobacter glacialis]
MSDSAFRPLPDEKVWEDLMHQLQEQAQGQPRPFFYNRVSARLISRPMAPGRTVPVWMLRPAYAALLGVIMLALSGDAGALRPVPAASTGTAPDSEQPLRAHPQ